VQEGFDQSQNLLLLSIRKRLQLFQNRLFQICRHCIHLEVPSLSLDYIQQINAASFEGSLVLSSVSHRNPAALRFALQQLRAGRIAGLKIDAFTKAMYQFSFLPYFPANGVDLKVNRLHLFNLWRAGAGYIQDPTVRARVERIANIYVTRELKPLDQITIAVLEENYAMKPLEGPQTNDLKNYVLALLFCSIAKNNSGSGHVNSTCTSEHFTLFHQDFNLEGEFIGYPTGSYYRVENVNTLGRTQMVKPDYVGDVLNHRYDRELFGAFCNLIDQNNSDDNFIFAALGWMRFAFLNSDGYPYASRVVMVATAYEVLFDLPDFKKEDTLAGAIEALLQTERMDRTGLPKLRKQNALGKEK